MAVTYYNANQVLTGAETVIADCSGGNIQITLPSLAAVGADGMVISVVRDGAANEVTVICAGADTYWDTDTTYTLDDDNAAVKVCARSGGSVWYGLGKFRTVTGS